MAKYVLEDMVKAKRERKPIIKEPKEEDIQEIQKIREREASKSKNRSRYVLWFVALVSIVFCFFAVSFLFAKASIMVTPKTKDVVLNENLSASKESSRSGLTFDVVVIPGEESTVIEATDEKDVQEVATGTAVLFNAFSSSSQRLDINTRLEGSNGKMYKTQTATIIPGMAKDGTPGSVEVKISGFEAGEAYNSSPLDFKIFGFKNTPKYAKFYGRSKGSISGGFVGKAPVVSETEKASAVAGLKTTLQDDLLKKASAQIPDGFVLFKNAIFLNTDDSNVTSTYKDTSLTLDLKGTLYGLIFNEENLTKKIAEDTVEKYDESDVYISHMEDLTFTLGNTNNAAFDSLENINFNLSGPAKIVWRLDAKKFTADLIGTSKSDFNTVLSKYQNVASATLILSPLWRTSIPKESKDIQVTVQYPQ